ncbi:uncharacterized protein F4822DRAFT_443186 [Hypoxylon trugodes]|uniref:uncharacterized protein n=1 Tax=Hypoxylon trugodes TaxID=326681 RepID=UPI00219237BA|nr:uncharacterized protein F4822DRAFT_443186 [Hypoxylon trugodes]KAI1390257.1 hypothetical protein F4822DRAFT_443186 [Hypoxylon trugodes]
MGSIDKQLPYWHVNVPENERTEECPEYLSTLSAKDIGIIGTPDSEYHVSTWLEVQKIVTENRLDTFRRVPSDLRRYLEYIWTLKRDYGSVMNFVLTQRLHWEAPIKPRGKPFEFEDDVKILWNDWPYGIDKRIVHLVVWTKFDLAEDPVTSDLTDEARAEIDGYVRKTFGSRIPSDRYIWFKNWRSLKSVHAVEHFHVMLFDPDPKFVDEITHGDVPQCRKF